MALFNYATKEITLKVVYYGPGLCGKTTNLQWLHANMAPDKTGKLLSLATDADRTLFFDFMPIHLGKIKGFNIRFQLYTVPGQVRYNATRKLVLKGADAIVFVADSQAAMKEANIESIQNMKDNLIANNIKPDEIPVILQYNKRDLPSPMSVGEMDKDLNPKSDEIIEAAAVNGMGVEETFKVVTKRLLSYISKKHNVQISLPEEEEKPAAKPAAAAPKAARPAAKEDVKITVKDKTSHNEFDDFLAEAAAEPAAPAKQAFDLGLEEAVKTSKAPQKPVVPAPAAKPTAPAKPAPAAKPSPAAKEEEFTSWESASLDVTSSSGWSAEQPAAPAESPESGGGWDSFVAETSAEPEAAEPSSHGAAVSGEMGPALSEVSMLLNQVMDDLRENKAVQNTILGAIKNLEAAVKNIERRIPPPPGKK